MMETKLVSAPSQGKALVSFIRPSAVGGAIKFGIWDSGNFVGILTHRACIQYETTPGEHYLLARAENWSCVKADLAANKHYVIKANPAMGVWKARVVLDPVTQADYQGQLEKVKKWLSEATPVTPDPQAAEAYAASRRKEVLDARAMFESDQGRYLTLEAGDSMP